MVAWRVFLGPLIHSLVDEGDTRKFLELRLASAHINPDPDTTALESGSASRPGNGTPNVSAESFHI